MMIFRIKNELIQQKNPKPDLMESLKVALRYRQTGHL